MHSVTCNRIGKGNPSFGKNRNLNALDAIIVFQLCSQKGLWSMFQFSEARVDLSVLPVLNVQPSIPQPILTVQQQTQATAFVQPTQQSHPQIEPTNQELSPNIVEVVQSSPVERPSTSTAVFGTGKINFKMKLE